MCQGSSHLLLADRTEVVQVLLGLHRRVSLGVDDSAFLLSWVGLTVALIRHVCLRLILRNDILKDNLRRSKLFELFRLHE